MIVTIYERDRHLGLVIQVPRTSFRSGLDWPSGLVGEEL